MDRGGQRRTLVATLLGVFVTAFPAVILVASLPEIAHDLGTSESTLAWVITLPLLISSVLLPTFGRLGDLEGHRKVFLWALGLSAATALLTACAWNAPSLIAFRTLSQTSGVATTPTAIALIMAAFGPDERPRALGQWAFVTAGAPALGLIFGGPLVTAVGWRGVFVVQGVLALLFFPFCRRWLQETPRASRVRFDLAGGLTLMVASGALLVALDRAAAWGLGHPAVLVAALVFPVGMVAFVAVERRARDPLLPLDLVRRRAWAAPVVSEFLLQVASNGVFFSAPLLLHDVFGKDVAQTAFLMLPLPLGMCAGAPLGGRIASRIGERTSGMLGALSMVAAMALFLAGNHVEALWLVVVALVVQGAANGLVRPSTASAAGNSLDPQFFGVGMATMRMTTQLGSAAGISLAVATRSLGGFPATFGAALAFAALGTVAMTRVVSRPLGEVDLAEEIEADALTTLPAFEG